MRRATEETLLVLAWVAAAVLGAAAAGLLTVGRVIWTHPYVLLSFAIVGVAGGLIHAAFRLDSPAYTITTVLLLALARWTLTPPLNAAGALNALIFALPVGGAFVLWEWINRRLGRVRLGKFVLLGLLLGAAHALVAFVLVHRLGQIFRGPVVLRQLLAGIKLGALVGFGIEIVDLGARLLRRTGPDPE